MNKEGNGMTKIGKIISWTIPIIMLFLAFLVCFFPIFPEENQFGKQKSERTTFVKNRKDTIAEFGNSRFVILRAYSKNEKKTYWSLYDNINYNIETRVYNFTQINSYVYAIGENGYTKLNYETAEVIQSKNLDEFSNEDKLIFKKLEDTKENVIIK